MRDDRLSRSHRQRWWVYTLRDGLIVRAQFCLDESTALEAMAVGGETAPPPAVVPGHREG